MDKGEMLDRWDSLRKIFYLDRTEEDWREIQSLAVRLGITICKSCEYPQSSDDPQKIADREVFTTVVIRGKETLLCSWCLGKHRMQRKRDKLLHHVK